MMITHSVSHTGVAQGVIAELKKGLELRAE